MIDIVKELIAAAIIALTASATAFFRKKGGMQTPLKLWIVALWTLLLIAVFLTGLVIFWPDEDTESGTLAPTKFPTLDVTLISARFLSEDYNPKLIDFRTAATDGVPIRKGVSLKLEDLWVWSSEISTEYALVAELYAYPGEKFLGASEAVEFIPEGAFAIGSLHPENYVHGEVDNAWMAQDDWEHLSVVLVLFKDGKPVKREHSSIKINSEGKSWLWDTPYARLIYVSYSVNDEAPLVLDLRSAVSSGIAANAGDIITLREVWYKSDSASGTHQIKVGGYLSVSTAYDETNEHYSDPNVVESGVKQLVGFESISWQVRPDDKFWVLSLTRSDDRTLFDRYYIPLNADGSGE